MPTPMFAAVHPPDGAPSAVAPVLEASVLPADPTPVSAVEHVPDLQDMVLVTTVDPGFGGIDRAAALHSAATGRPSIPARAADPGAGV